MSENTEIWNYENDSDEIKEKAKKKLKKILLVCTIFMLIEIIGAYYSHSIAILTDACHLLSDQLGFVISLSSIYISEKTSPKRTFGNGRAEILGALGSIVIIWMLTVIIFMEAFERMISIMKGQLINLKSGMMIILALGSLLMNLVMIFILDVDDVEKAAEEI